MLTSTLHTNDAHLGQVSSEYTNIDAEYLYLPTAMS